MPWFNEFSHEHVVFIEGNEKFQLGGEDLEKALPFSKILKFYLLRTPIFQNFDLIYPTLEVFSSRDLTY